MHGYAQRVFFFKHRPLLAEDVQMYFRRTYEGSACIYLNFPDLSINLGKRDGVLFVLRL